MPMPMPRSAMLHDAALARRAAMFILSTFQVRSSLVNGTASAILACQDQPVDNLGFTIAAERIA